MTETEMAEAVDGQRLLPLPHQGLAGRQTKADTIRQDMQMSEKANMPPLLGMTALLDRLHLPQQVGQVIADTNHLLLQ